MTQERGWFLEGKEPHQMEATKLGVPRKVGKRIRHGVSYGMGGETLAEYFNLPLTETLALRKAFWDNHPELKRFKQQLDSADGFETPLLDAGCTLISPMPS